jgi:hypothetical protein
MQQVFAIDSYLLFTSVDMKDDLLRNPNDTGDLLAGALKRHRDKPVLFLGDTTLTGGQLADRISQYIQAFGARGGRRCRRTSLGGPGVPVQSPKQVVVDSLPLTAFGKPDKKTVRAKFWEGADRAVG